MADFGGGAVSRLGLGSASTDVAVFVFDGSGKLVERWTGVPPEDTLAKAVATAER